MTDRLRELVDAERGLVHPAPDAAERNLGGVARRIAAGAPAPFDVALPAPDPALAAGLVGGKLGVKALVAVALVTAGAGAGAHRWLSARSHEVGPARAVVEARASAHEGPVREAPAREVAPAPPSPPPRVLPPIPEALPAPRLETPAAREAATPMARKAVPGTEPNVAAPVPPPVPPPTASGPDVLSAELELILAIRTAWKRGQLDRAETLAAEHARRFPEGMLAEDREALRTLAACDRGDPGSRASASSFAARYPRSTYTESLRERCR